jgi:hypothetical protein
MSTWITGRELQKARRDQPHGIRFELPTEVGALALRDALLSQGTVARARGRIVTTWVPSSSNVDVAAVSRFAFAYGALRPGAHSPTLRPRIAGRESRGAGGGAKTSSTTAASSFGKGLTVTVTNTTPYDTRDLARFFAKGLAAMGAGVSKHVKCIPTTDFADKASRGVANVGRCPSGDCRHELAPVRRKFEARSMVLAMPPPSRMTKRRLARLFWHELLHTFSKDHDDMTTAEYWSLGPVPSWASGVRVRYAGGRDLR